MMAGKGNVSRVQKRQGFTLIEVMVVMAIVAILTMVAIPSYKSFIDKAAIKTAQSDLVALSLNYENFYQRTLAYPTSDYTTTADLEAAFSSWSPASKDTEFSFATENAASTAYTLKATGLKGDLSGCVITLGYDGTRSIASCTYGSSGDWL